ncbi:replication initiator [Intrasporangium sp. DVR]|uniref:replication initiator n=1 Tax=Intrasporangium sp. DVR TaxID=3127867 RepID=UPI00313A5E08
MTGPGATRDASSLSSTGFGSFPGFGEGAPLDVPGLDQPHIARALVGRLRDGSWHAFAETAASVGYCSQPVRLIGHSETYDWNTGELVSSFRSQDTPLGVLYRRCGNRRAHVCPSCSRVYARDTFELIRAGVAGGKTVPETVADNPLLFVTLTAPSFGLVHGTRHGGRACRPRRKDDRTRCPHGRPTWCHATHDEGDEATGQPLCVECYDYTSHVLWQWWAPELWRRFTIDVRRRLARLLGVKEHRLPAVASLQYAKVAEPQHRGVMHFHALVRLDGPAKDGVGSPAPACVDVDHLTAVLRAAAAHVEYLAPPAYPDDPGHVLRFGAQVDARAVHTGNRVDDPAGPVTPAQVAGYLAKYATKDASNATGDTRCDTAHLRAIREACRTLHGHARDRAEEARATGQACENAEPDPYLLLGKWTHMLGFRGHFSTKSRRYSITLGALRRARHRWQIRAAQAQRTSQPLDVADLEAQLLAEDEDETTLVVGSWTYDGTGWATPGDAALANAAAARAREYDQWRADQRQGQGK